MLALLFCGDIEPGGAGTCRPAPPPGLVPEDTGRHYQTEVLASHDLVTPKVAEVGTNTEPNDCFQTVHEAPKRVLLIGDNLPVQKFFA